jgi:hypothetical protein
MNLRGILAIAAVAVFIIAALCAFFTWTSLPTAVGIIAVGLACSAVAAAERPSV